MLVYTTQYSFCVSFSMYYEMIVLLSQMLFLFVVQSLFKYTNTANQMAVKWLFPDLSY